MQLKNIFLRPVLKTSLYSFLLFFIFVGPLLHAQQVYFFDDFENGLDKWIVSGQDWDTTSKAKAYVSPYHSITDSPTGNYGANVNATIILDTTVNLSAATFPVLSFWHKYLISFRDSIIVDVSNDGGFKWFKLKSWYSNKYQSTWTFEQIDLRKYKSNNVKIRFRLRADGGTGVYEVNDGWYIDDVKLIEWDAGPKLSLNFFDDFENDLNNWIMSGQDWALTTSKSLSPSHSITDSPGGNYAANANATITLKGYFDLSNSISPQLSFWHQYYVEFKDSIIVEISKDGGWGWTKLQGWYSQKFQSTWTLELYDLKSFKSNIVKIRFRLRANEGTGQYDLADGWYLDDIEIKDGFTKVIPSNISKTLPQSHTLFQNYPNPFNSDTIISFQLSAKSNVQLIIYNMQGQLVRKLVDAQLNAGEWATAWDSKDETGNNMASGFYLCQLKIDEGSWTCIKKMILMR